MKAIELQIKFLMLSLTRKKHKKKLKNKKLLKFTCGNSKDSYKTALLLVRNTDQELIP